MEASNGCTSLALGHSAFAAFQKSLDLPDDWEQCQQQEGWETAAMHAIAMCDTTADETRAVSAKTLAAGMYRCFRESACLPVEDFFSLLSVDQLAWEVAARHVATLIGSDGTLDDWESLQQEGRVWLKKKLAERLAEELVKEQA